MLFPKPGIKFISFHTGKEFWQQVIKIWKHQKIERKCLRITEDALTHNTANCNCEVYHELDWIIDENTVVRPNVMIVCGEFQDDFLRFSPSLVVEITSRRTQMQDRNIKFKLYEANHVPY